MKVKSMWGMCLAIILLSLGAAAQQSETPPKPPEGGSSPPASTGTAATPRDAESSQKVVLKVGATQITQSEINALVDKMGSRGNAMIKAQGRRPLGEQYAKLLMLAQQALDDHLDSSPAIRFQLEYQRAQILAGAEYQKMSGDVKVSQDEVSQYFVAHPSEFEAVQVRQFLIRKRPQGSDDAKAGLTPEDAKAKAESIRKALLAGTDVDKVAEEFAGPHVLMIDRSPRTFRRAQMVPDLEKATFELPDGGVSEPVDTPQALYVVKVLKHQHSDLKEVATEIENKLRQQKLNAEMDTLGKKAGVWMDEEYFKAKPAAPAGSATAAPASPQTPKP